MTSSSSLSHPNHLVVVLGGARSGKSNVAVEAGRAYDGPVTCVATSPRINGDNDLNSRILAHQQERPRHWNTIESEVDLATSVRAAEGLLIIDCLTVWVGNMLHHGHDEASIHSASAEAIANVTSRNAPVIAITNEVGSGIIPDNKMAREYRDILGRVNQRWVAASRQSYLMVAGRALELTALDTKTVLGH